MTAERDTPSKTTTTWRHAETVDTIESAEAMVSARHPALTILYHPDLSRVGERARLALLTLGKPVVVSRLEPLFAAPGAEIGSPLADPRLSRRPVRLSPAPDGGVLLDATGTSTEVRLNGEAVQREQMLAPGLLEAGVVLELSSHFVLLLHRVCATGPPRERYGIVGDNDAMDRLRGDILRVADVSVPVLLRGSSGTGKELVARAIHEASPRSGRPWLTVNIAAVNPSTAASELFGHRRGAFTGADRDHPGYFGRADGGTLFLDEIGEASPEIQSMLLRVLETGEVQPVGEARTRRVDVRLVSATDADLELACREGRFRAPLLHRLSGYEITIPALRQRPDDIPRLFLHFLRQELASVGEGHRLRATDGPPWLPAQLVARLVRCEWPGNVRQLRNVARQIVISSRGSDVARVDPSVERLLSQAGAARSGRSTAVDGRSPPSEAGSGPSLSPASEGHGSRSDRPARTRPAYLSDDELVATLRRHQWSLGPTASDLGISRTTLYALIERSDRIRKARDLTAEEIRAALAESGGDVDGAAERLEVSKRGLQLRTRELGLSAG